MRLEETIAILQTRIHFLEDAQRHTRNTLSILKVESKRQIKSHRDIAAFGLADMVRDDSERIMNKLKGYLTEWKKEELSLKRRLRRMKKARVCSDCPPVGYPTDKTRCSTCPNKRELIEAK